MSVSLVFVLVSVLHMYIKATGSSRNKTQICQQKRLIEFHGGLLFCCFGQTHIFLSDHPHIKLSMLVMLITMGTNTGTHEPKGRISFNRNGQP